jgi:hypothetical protein
MAEIINLRQVRKARERAAKDETATENRIAFGRPRRPRPWPRPASPWNPRVTRATA